MRTLRHDEDRKEEREERGGTAKKTLLERLKAKVVAAGIMAVVASCTIEPDIGVTPGPDTGTEEDGGKTDAGDGGHDAGPDTSDGGETGDGGSDGGSGDGGTTTDGGDGGTTTDGGDGGTTTDGGSDGGTDGGLLCGEVGPGSFMGTANTGGPVMAGGYSIQYTGRDGMGNALFDIECSGGSVVTGLVCPPSVMTSHVDTDNGRTIQITPSTVGVASCTVNINVL
ncbi:MAG: hypothetical protein AB1324_01855 [Candidatus Micrarchaeota archaeon]